MPNSTSDVAKMAQDQKELKTVLKESKIKVANQSKAEKNSAQKIFRPKNLFDLKKI